MFEAKCRYFSLCRMMQRHQHISRFSYSVYLYSNICVLQYLQYLVQRLTTSIVILACKNRKGKYILQLVLYLRHLSVHFLHEALVVESCKGRPATTEVNQTRLRLSICKNEFIIVRSHFSSFLNRSLDFMLFVFFRQLL